MCIYAYLHLVNKEKGVGRASQWVFHMRYTWVWEEMGMWEGCSLHIHAFFFVLNLNPSQLTHGVIMISGLELSDSSLTYNTQCSSQQVSSLMLLTHLVHPPTQLPSSNPHSVCSLYLRISWFVCLPVFILFLLTFPCVHLFCILKSTNEWSHMTLIFLWLTYLA